MSAKTEFNRVPAATVVTTVSKTFCHGSPNMRPLENHGMTKLAFRHIAVLTAAVFVGFLAADAQGQNITRVGSGVEAMFASQSEAYMASDPLTLPPFGPAGAGPYYPGNGLPNSPVPGTGLPNLPAPPTPSYIPPAGNAFAGGGWPSSFNDLYSLNGFTAAQSVIYDNISSSPTVTSDINIGAYMSLYQAPSAPGYAYEQLNFGSDYFLGSNPGLASSTPNLPIYVSGTVVGSSSAYAQFDAVVDYTWFPGSFNGTTTFTVSGPSVTLGQLSYSFYQAGGGSFNTTLYSSGTLLATPNNDGILALDGYMWVAGDPVDVTISSSPIPEPSTLVLLAVGIVGLLAYAWRRRGEAR